MNFPDNLRYSKEHEWIRNENGIGYIGITDFAQGQLGDIVYIEVDAIGEAMDTDEVFGTVEAVKTVTDLFMPVKGKIIEFNNELEDNPELVNDDPYGKGWMVKIEINDAGQLNDLLDSAAYADMVGA